MMASTSAPASTLSPMAPRPGRKPSNPQVERSAACAAVRSGPERSSGIRPLPVEITADDVEEDMTVLGELDLAHAMDLGHVGRRLRLAPRHVDQALVREDQIGGGGTFLGELEAAALERLEQRRIRLRCLPWRGRCGIAGAAAQRLERVLAQR